jgi:hypothetical protein
MFDENMGKPVVAALAKLLAYAKPPPIVEHVIDFEGHNGVDDRVWIPKLAALDCVVFSSDTGRHKREARLPMICQGNGITLFLFSPTLHNSSQFEKARAVVSLWPSIMEAANGPRGKRYSIQRGPGLHSVIIEK